jgi:hypothetical protein
MVGRVFINQNTMALKIDTVKSCCPLEVSSVAVEDKLLIQVGKCSLAIKFSEWLPPEIQKVLNFHTALLTGSPADDIDIIMDDPPLPTTINPYFNYED